MTAAIVGWAHSKFGKAPEMSVESLITKVTLDAIADAGIDPSDVDEIILGHFRILPLRSSCRRPMIFASSPQRASKMRARRDRRRSIRA